MPKTAFFSYCFFEDPRRRRPRSEAARSFAAQQHPPQRKVEQKKWTIHLSWGYSAAQSAERCCKISAFLHRYTHACMAPTRVCCAILTVGTWAQADTHQSISLLGSEARGHCYAEIWLLFFKASSLIWKPILISNRFIFHLVQELIFNWEYRLTHLKIIFVQLLLLSILNKFKYLAWESLYCYIKLIPRLILSLCGYWTVDINYILI